jgi:hypothetical protein
MLVLSMLETIKEQFMARHYSKEKEVGDLWLWTICLKIRKKVSKILEWANTCFPLPSGKVIFQVQDRDISSLSTLDLGSVTAGGGT